MEIIKKLENGTLGMDKQAFVDIAQASIKNMKNIYPPKKGKDFVFCKIKDNKLNVLVSIKIKQGIDIMKTCNKIQTNIHEAIEEMTGIDCGIINIDIQGFVNNK